jgi:hypothetical protein
MDQFFCAVVAACVSRFGFELLAERVNALASVRAFTFAFRHSYFQAFSLFSS